MNMRQLGKPRLKCYTRGNCLIRLRPIIGAATGCKAGNSWDDKASGMRALSTASVR